MKRKALFRTLVWTAVGAIALLSLTAGAGAVQGDKKIRLLDDCDPTTFNAVLGDGACVGDGHTTFDEFIAELAATQDAHAWRNQPSNMHLNTGRPTLIENRGGETHTFTPVAEFGGGPVDAHYNRRRGSGVEGRARRSGCCETRSSLISHCSFP